MTQPRILYFLNGLGRGGAELGLRTMLEGGLFTAVDLRVVVMHRGSEDLRTDVAHLLGNGNLIEGGAGPNLTFTAAAIASCKLFYQLVTFKPEIVVLSLKQANIIGRFLLCFFPRIRCIAFEHIAHLERGRAVGIYERALRALSGRVDEVWGDCPATLRATRAYYGESPRTERFVPLFVASDDAPRKIEYALHSPARIATASRLVPRKRVDVLLKAVRFILESGRTVEVTVFGDGPDRTHLEKLAADLHLSSVVTFAGFVHEWWRVGTESDVFVHLSEDEGFCISAAEAMMVGLPVIASGVGGVLDYSHDLRDAIHMQSLDPSEVARTIQNLLNNHGRRAELGRRAAAAIRSRFAAATVRRHYRRIAATFAPPISEPD